MNRLPRAGLYRGARRSRARQSMAYWALEALDGSKTALSSLDRVEGTDPPAYKPTTTTYLPIAGPSGAVKTGPTYLLHGV